MAARSSAGVGVGITITLLGVASLALFITTIVFYSKYQRADRELTTERETWDQWVRRDEQSSDTIGRIKEVAKKDNKSVVGYLNTSLRTAMQRVTGNAGDNMERMNSELARVEGLGAGNLLGVIRDRDAAIADLTTKLAQADNSRRTALEDLKAESDRVKARIEAYDRTVAALNADIDRTKAEVEQYRQSVNAAKSGMDENIEKVREQAATEKSALTERVRKLEQENLQLNERVATLQQAKTSNILKPVEESALVDGQIVGASPGTRTVDISLGRKDKVMVGMRFSVYADATTIKPGPDGEYPAGKATIEVKQIGENSSACRVMDESKGNPIVRGDVIANAIYDPRKVYTLLVYGNFDVNGDRAATPAEANDLRALIEEWGGQVTDELTGNVDFLVLGQRPVVPPAPKAGDPWPVVEEYMRLDRMSARYDDLHRQAVSTSLPVLNENRLYTLIGGRPSAR